MTPHLRVGRVLTALVSSGEGSRRVSISVLVTRMIVLFPIVKLRVVVTYSMRIIVVVRINGRNRGLLNPKLGVVTMFNVIFPMREIISVHGASDRRASFRIEG